jgi:hypothetical protein
MHQSRDFKILPSEIDMKLITSNGGQYRWLYEFFI